MRVAVVVLGVQPDTIHQFLNLPPSLAFALVQAVDRVGLGDDRPDRLAGVQRRVGVLEDHLQIAVECLQPAALALGDVLSLEQDASGGGIEQAHQEPCGGALAAPGFADDPQRLPGLDSEGDLIDRLHRADPPLEDDPLRDRKMLGEATSFDQGGGRHRDHAPPRCGGGAVAVVRDVSGNCSASRRRSVGA